MQHYGHHLISYDHPLLHRVVCLCLQLMFMAYLFFLVWLGVTAFTSLPVFMYFNVWSMCQNTSVVEGTNMCLDLRQFGMCYTNQRETACYCPNLIQTGELSPELLSYFFLLMYLPTHWKMPLPDYSFKKTFAPFSVVRNPLRPAKFGLSLTKSQSSLLSQAFLCSFSDNRSESQSEERRPCASHCLLNDVVKIQFTLCSCPPCCTPHSTDTGRGRLCSAAIYCPNPQTAPTK